MTLKGLWAIARCGHADSHTWPIEGLASMLATLILSACTLLFFSTYTHVYAYMCRVVCTD